MAAPIEIMAGVVNVYYAPAGTAMGDVDDDPAAGDWTLLGKVNGATNMPSGVTLEMPQTVVTDPFRMLDGGLPKGAGITGQDIIVRFMLSDLRTTPLAVAVHQDDTAVSDVAPGAATGGYESVSLVRPLLATELAWLLRNDTMSTEGAGLAAMFYLPRATQRSTLALNFRKEPVALNFELVALEDDTYGPLAVFQTDEPTG